MHLTARLAALVPLVPLAACAADQPTSKVDPFAVDGGPKLIVMACPPLAAAPLAATVFVDAAAKSGDGSRTAPFPTLAQAFAAAGVKGVIYAAAGTYRESLVIPDKDLTLVGGFTNGFAARTDGCATILEAPAPAQTVLEAAPEVKRFRLDGVTVQNGARGLSVSAQVSGAEYTITSSVFSGNGTVDQVGGAVAIDNASLTVTRSAFHDNRADKGAAIALNGDAAAITIDASVFETNTGHGDHGGALYLSPKSGAITRSTFRRNTIGATAGYGWGGAVIIYRAGAAPASTDFAYNVFTDNLASIGGGVFIDDGATATMSHDLLYRNRSYAENGVSRGGAIYVDGLNTELGSRLVADHLTVANNNLDRNGIVSPATGGGAFLEEQSSATFTNSIFWHNGENPLFGVDAANSITVRYSIAGACSTATCTIGPEVFEPADVAFADEGVDDFHEKSTAGHFLRGSFVRDVVTSPAVDRADPASPVGDEPAPNGGRANLGAFGGTTEASKSDQK